MGIINRVVVILSTFFYAGYFPFIPGTFASIVGIFLFYLIKDNILIYIPFTLLLMLLGFLVTAKAEKIFKRKDARCIVIDEVSGMLLALIFIPSDIRIIIIAFLLFRILDTFKPYPAGKLQDLGGSIGIMGDDFIAALYTNIILQFVLRLASFKTS